MTNVLIYLLLYVVAGMINSFFIFLLDNESVYYYSEDPVFHACLVFGWPVFFIFLMLGFILNLPLCIAKKIKGE